MSHNDTVQTNPLTADQKRFLVPEAQLNPAGAERKVGIEIELSAPDIDVLVNTVSSCFGGKAHSISQYEWEVNETEFGQFIVEVDYDYLKRAARESIESDSIVDDLQTQALGTISKGLVPYEIVTPPIPVTRLDCLEVLTVKLRELGCKGTRDAIWKAYGVHYNPELAALDANSISRHLQAYVCLHDWLRERESVDLARRVTPYIDPFGEDYTMHIIQENYQPELSELIDDYIHYNPTRNRTLDMLPLFSHLDDDRVRSKIQDELIKARPTFHYRLPNCDIDDAQWSMARAWNDWCVVEALANDQPVLRAVCEHYLDHLANVLPDIIDPWHKKVEKWLVNLSSQ